MYLLLKNRGSQLLFVSSPVRVGGYFTWRQDCSPQNSADPCASVWSVRGSKRKPSNAAAPLIHQPDVWSPGEETRTEFWSGPSSSYGNNLQTRIWHVFIWIHMYTCLLHESLAYRIKPFHLEEIMMIKSKKWSTKSINPSRKEFSFHPNLQPFKIDASYVWFSRPSSPSSSPSSHVFGVATRSNSHAM